MSDIIEQLERYRAHFDRALETETPTPPQWSDDVEDRESVQIRLAERMPATTGEARSRRPFILAGCAACIVLVALVALVVTRDPAADFTPGAAPGATSSDGRPVADASPSAVIEGFVAAYNSGDIDAVMSYFDEDSVITGHPFSEHADGPDEIRTTMLTDLAVAADTDAYTISNLETTGATVTFDHRWTNTAGTDYCGTGHTATVDNGTITTWNWPTRRRCSEP